MHANFAAYKYLKIDGTYTFYNIVRYNKSNDLQRNMRPRLDINSYIGKKYNRLTIKKHAETINKNGKNRYMFWCECDCGNICKIIELAHLKRKKNATTSCGCHKKKITRELNLIHGLSGHRLYYVWSSIKDKCNNPNNKDYRWYGLLGIKLHKDWMERPDLFIEYIEKTLGPCPEKHSLDRINVRKSYEPGNLRWATYRTQALNQRRYT